MFPHAWQGWVEWLTQNTYFAEDGVSSQEGYVPPPSDRSGWTSISRSIPSSLLHKELVMQHGRHGGILIFRLGGVPAPLCEIDISRGNCHLVWRSLQGISMRPFPGLVKFVPPVAYPFCLNFPAAFWQPGNGLIKIPCNSANIYAGHWKCIYIVQNVFAVY